jgi:hypothetical protein
VAESGVIFACRARTGACTHDGVTLYWYAACQTHGCRHMLAAVLLGLRAEQLPPRPTPADPIGPPLGISDSVMVARQTGLAGYGPTRTFIVATWARLSPASTFTRLVEWGLS